MKRTTRLTRRSSPGFSFTTRPDVTVELVDHGPEMGNDDLHGPRFRLIRTGARPLESA